MVQPTDPAYQRAKTEMVRKILNMGLAGLGAGAAIRGALGLKNLMQEPYESPFVSPGPSTLEMPVVADTTDDEAALAKLASDVASNSGVVAALADKVKNLIPDDPISTNVSNLRHSPWAVPLMVGGTAAGLYGGYSLVDSLLNSQRKQQQEEALAEAQAEYERALQEQAQAGHKYAADDPYGGLHTVYDQWQEKRATIPGAQWLTDRIGNAAAAALAVAGITGVGSGIAAYNYGRRASQDKAVRRALQNRSQRLWMSQLQPLTIVPSPVPPT